MKQFETDIREDLFRLLDFKARRRNFLQTFLLGDNDSDTDEKEPTLIITNPVGAGQLNYAQDVKDVQIALRLLGYEIPEEEIPEGDDLVQNRKLGDDEITLTIEAIKKFQVDHFGPPSPNARYGYIGKSGDTIKKINQIIVYIEGTVGGKTDDENAALDVKKIQDALIELGETISADEFPVSGEIEINARITPEKLPQTVKAINSFQMKQFPQKTKGDDHLGPNGDTIKRINSLLNEKAKKAASPTTDKETTVDKKGSPANPSQPGTIKHDVEVKEEKKPEVQVDNKEVPANSTEALKINADVTKNLDVKQVVTHPKSTLTAAEYKQIKKNRETDFTKTAVVPGQALKTSPITNEVGDTTTATANDKDDVVKIQNVLVALGFLKSGVEVPSQIISKFTKVYAKDAKNIKKEHLKLTIEAIKKAQNHFGVSYLSTSKTAQLKLLGMDAKISPAYKSGLVRKNDATYTVLTNYTKTTITFQIYDGTKKSTILKNFTKYQAAGMDPVHSYGNTGDLKPDLLAPKLDTKLFTDIGLSVTQAKALMWVSANEGGFDAFNTYDNQYISVGFSQLSGNNTFERYLAYIKYREPDLFKKYFADYGIDVDFTVGKTNVDNVKLYIYDPDGNAGKGQVLIDEKGKNGGAKKYIREHPELIAAFVRAAYDPRIQAVQIETTVREYVRYAEKIKIHLSVSRVEILSADKKKTEKKYVGLNAQNYKKDKVKEPLGTYATLKAAGRIKESSYEDNPLLVNIIKSEMGLAAIYDITIHRWTDEPKASFQKAINQLAVEKGYDSLTQVQTIDELSILKKVRDNGAAGGFVRDRMIKLLTPAPEGSGRTYKYHQLSSSKP